MDFTLSRSQKEIQKAARDFAKGEFDKDLAQELDRKGEFSRTVRRKAAELGFIGIHFDEACLGGGMGMMENVLLAEELCRKDSGMGAALMLAGYGAECLLRFGENSLKKQFLRGVAEGESLSAAAFYETDSGSDLREIRTTAVKEGEEWVIRGEKVYVINGTQAGFCIVLCRTDPEAGPDKALSMFLTEMDREGMSAENMGEKLGARMVSTSRMHLDNVRVPASHIIGKEGHGLAQAYAFFDESRVLSAAMSLGTAQGAFDRALDYVRQREQFGRKIAQFEVTRHKLADMATKIELARLITYQAAWKFDRGGGDTRLSCMAKLYASQAAVEVADEALQLLGGYGYMTEYGIERFYRDAKIIELFENRKGMQKNAVADILIGQRMGKMK